MTRVYTDCMRDVASYFQHTSLLDATCTAGAIKRTLKYTKPRRSVEHTALVNLNSNIINLPFSKFTKVTEDFHLSRHLSSMLQPVPTHN